MRPWSTTSGPARRPRRSSWWQRIPSTWAPASGSRPCSNTSGSAMTHHPQRACHRARRRPVAGRHPLDRLPPRTGTRCGVGTPDGDRERQDGPGDPNALVQSVTSAVLFGLSPIDREDCKTEDNWPAVFFPGGFRTPAVYPVEPPRPAGIRNSSRAAIVILSGSGLSASRPSRSLHGSLRCSKAAVRRRPSERLRWVDSGTAGFGQRGRRSRQLHFGEIWPRGARPPCGCGLSGPTIAGSGCGARVGQGVEAK